MRRDTLLKSAVLILPICAVVYNFTTNHIALGQLQYNVQSISNISLLETKYAYWLVHLCSFLPVFLLSFDRRVHFYTRWRHLFPAIAIVGVFFIVWDYFKTSLGVWGFNPAYVTAYLLGLPIEEWLFFVTIPYCSVFIYECANYYIRWDVFEPIEPMLSWSIAALFWVVGISTWGLAYTSTTFLLCAAFQTWHLLHYPANHYRSRFYLAFLIALLPFWLVDSTLTGAFTAQAIVIYNPAEHLNFRLPTIPIEDFAYGYLMLFMVISLFEYLRSRHTLRK